MAQEAPNTSRPPFEEPIAGTDVLSWQWHQYIATLILIIADLQRRVTALGG